MTTTPSTTALDGAVAGRARPPRPSALSASRTFAWRALLKLKHVPEQLIDVIGLPVIFTLGFTYLFGGALAGSTRQYLQFLLPGTLAMTVVLVTTYSGVTLNTDLTKGVSDRFRSLPIWRPAPILGALLGDTGRYLLAATIVIALGVALGFRPDGGVVGVGGGGGAAAGVRVWPVMDLDHPRTGPSRPQRGQQLQPTGAVPPDPGQQHLRGPGDHAGLAAGLHRHQPH
jgi:hypothetical protein